MLFAVAITFDGDTFHILKQFDNYKDAVEYLVTEQLEDNDPLDYVIFLDVGNYFAVDCSVKI